MTQFLPVTQEQATDTKINQSVKISKQLMKSELTLRKEQALDEYRQHDRNGQELYRKLHDLFLKETAEFLQQWFKNNKDMSTFRRLLKTYSRYNEKPRSNYAAVVNNIDLMDGHTSANALHAVLTSSNKEDCQETLERRQKFLLGVLDISIDLIIPDITRFSNDDDDEFMGFDLEVPVSQEVRNLFHEYKQIAKNAKLANNKYNELDKQLKNIAAVTEQMEAQLLVNELAKSPEGKEALKIASDMVSQMLGEQPAMLTDATKP